MPIVLFPYSTIFSIAIPYLFVSLVIMYISLIIQYKSNYKKGNFRKMDAEDIGPFIAASLFWPLAGIVFVAVGIGMLLNPNKWSQKFVEKRYPALKVLNKLKDEKDTECSACKFPAAALSHNHN